MANSFLHFHRDLMSAVLLYEHGKHSILDHAGKIIEDEAKDVIGTYRYGWPELAESTQEQRTRLGFAPNEPLLRDGSHIRDTISRDVHEHENYVDIGSDSEIAAYNELGTINIPPRSFLSMASENKEEQVVDEIGGRVHLTFLTGLKLA